MLHSPTAALVRSVSSDLGGLVEPWATVVIGGLAALGVVYLALVLHTLADVSRSPIRRHVRGVWIGIVVVAPLLGSIAWLALHPGGGHPAVHPGPRRRPGATSTSVAAPPRGTDQGVACRRSSPDSRKASGS